MSVETPPPGKNSCECRDCESAVGPAAYLTELLEYTGQFVEDGDGTAMGQTQLFRNFYQPYGDLPTDCEAVEESVRYLRVAVESLLGYVDETDGLENLLNDGGRVPDPNGYRRAAYEALLESWGTSLAEIRRARHDQDTREGVADRLGINPAHVADGGGSDLFLDVSTEFGVGNPTATDALSGTNLEALFGWPAALEVQGATIIDRRPPLSDVGTPSIETWRAEALRETWTERDYPSDPFPQFLTSAATVSGSLAGSADRHAIDPDLLSADDFRTPDASASTAFEVWIRRRNWADEQLEGVYDALTDAPDLAAAVVTALDAKTEYAAAGGTVTVEPLNDWGTVQSNVSDLSASNPTFSGLSTLVSAAQGDDPDAARSGLETLNLTVESAARLVELVEKHRRTRGSPKASDVDAEAFWDLASVVVAARKRALAVDWIAEERSEGVQLGDAAFWGATREPTEGTWSSRLATSDPADLPSGEGIADVAAGTVTVDVSGNLSATPQTVGFEPDLIVFDASSAGGSADEESDGESGFVGWSQGAATVAPDGTVTQQAIYLGADGASAGKAVGVAESDAALVVAPESGGRLSLSVARAIDKGFELSVDDASLGSAVHVEYRAYRTAVDAAVEVGSFRTPQASGEQTVPLGIDANHVELWATSPVESFGSAVSTSDAAGFSRGIATGRETPTQSVVTTTVDPTTGTAAGAAAARDDRALVLQYGVAAGSARETTASVTGLGRTLRLHYDAVYDGDGPDPGDRRLVLYVAVDSGDGPAPAVGSVETPTSAGDTVEVTTGFRPAAVEFDASTAVPAFGGGGTTDGAPVGRSRGWATAPTGGGSINQSVIGHTVHTDSGRFAHEVSSDHAVTLLYVDSQGTVTGRDRAEVTAFTENGFEMTFGTVADSGTSTADHDRVLVRYRAWPETRRPKPLVDPTRVDRSDLPGPTAGSTARTLYDDRVDEMEREGTKLRDTFYGSGTTGNPFEAVLTSVYGDFYVSEPFASSDWGEYFAAVLTGLDGGDPAARRVLAAMGLSREEFERVRSIRRRSDPTTDADLPEERELTAVLERLVEEWVRLDRWDGWIDAERNPQGGREPITEYWEARRGHLPRWRATSEARTEWQRARGARRAPSVVDPDLVDLDVLDVGANPSASSNPAYGRWQARRTALDHAGSSPHADVAAITTEVGNLQSASGSGVASQFDALLSKWIGIDADELRRLADRREKGADLSARLAQLDLPQDAFAYLVDVQERIDRSQPVLDETWANVRNLLVQVWKRRIFGRWRREEQAVGVTFGPEQFRLPDPADEEGVPDEDAPTRWRHSRSRRNEWLDTLESRIGTRDGVTEAVAEAVGAAEEAALPKFRDWLVETGSLPGRVASDERAEWLTERLLLDVETDACRETTRVGAAIESIQTLVFAIEQTGTNEGLREFDLTNVDDSFDERWRWLGTYPKWRSAMGVYFFPENLLLPTLREQQSAGFRDAADDLATGGDIAPASAGAVAERYADYFEDVCQMEPIGGCVVEVSDPPAEIPLAGRYDDDHVGYAVGKPEWEDRYYWRPFDPAASEPEYPLGLWRPVDEIPPLRDEEVVGVIDTVGHGSTLYLFVSVAKKDRSDIGYVTYDLGADAGWSEYSRIPLPGSTVEVGGESSDGSDDGGPDEVSFLLKSDSYQFDVEFSYGQGLDQPPELVIGTSFVIGDDFGHEFYIGSFDSDGNPPTRSSYEEVARPYRRYYPDRIPLRKVTRHGDQRLLFISDSMRSGNASEIYRYDMSTGSEWTRVWSRDGFRDVVLFESSSRIFFGREDGDLVTDILELSPTPVGNASNWTVSSLDEPLFSVDSPINRIVQCHYPTSEAKPTKDFDVLDGLYLTDVGGEDDFAWHSDFGAHVSRIGDSDVVGLFAFNTEALRPVNDRNDHRWQYGYTLKDGETTPTPELADTEPYALTQHLWFVNSLDERQATRVYLREAFFQVPMLIARRLHAAGQYDAALDWFRMVYDFTDGTQPWYPLARWSAPGSGISPPSKGWLTDPLQPHQIAQGRPNTTAKYLQFTLLSESQCLLDYADAEFTRDTAEAVAHARELYETGLDLLDHDALAPAEDPCRDLTVELDTRLPSPDSAEVDTEVAGRMRDEVIERVEEIDAYRRRANLVEAIETSMDEATADEAESLATARLRAAAEAAENWEADDSETVGTVVERRPAASREVFTDLLTDDAVARQVQAAGDLRVSVRARGTIHGDGSQSEPIETTEPYTPQANFDFCVPANPIFEALRRRARLNLQKIRNCRNIAGMRRNLDAYAAGTGVQGAVPTPDTGVGGSDVAVQPTRYRFEVLLERARTLAEQAQQIESRYFMALQSIDEETYKLLEARQDVELAEAELRVQELRVSKARNNVQLARLERERASMQVETYQRWIDAGLNKWERQMIKSYRTAGQLRQDAIALGAMVKASQMMTTVATAGAAAPAAAIAAAAGLAANQSRASMRQRAVQARTQAKLASVKASQARREQRWQLQKKLAKQDVRIGQQKVRLARDDVRIADQRRQVSELKTDHAKDVVEFLSDEQFSDRDLFRWMSEQLGQVYRYFLQQAASVAKLAELQLAFRRQAKPLDTIGGNYWQDPGDGQSEGTRRSRDGEGSDADRRGVTGAARLLEDIWRLDEHEFRTDERRLTVEKTFSLAKLDPLALQQFRETGVLTFSTPLVEFEEDHPELYHRLIEDVSVNVLALASPVEGMKATLRNAGTSRVTVGETVFRETVVDRDPASVVLHPHGDDETDGVRLEPRAEETLRPFEGLGVETRWELRLLKPANDLDYDTIGDVQFTVKYSARESATHGEQVKRELGTERSVDLTFSLADDFADEWYDLKNPEQSADPMTVEFETSAADFPANFADAEIGGVQLYFVGTEPDAVSEMEVDLGYSPAGTETSAGGPATPVDGLVTTPGASAWTDVTGKPAAGTWTLSLPTTPRARSLVSDGELEDLLVVLTVEGEVPEWPR